MHTLANDPRLRIEISDGWLIDLARKFIDLGNQEDNINVWSSNERPWRSYKPNTLVEVRYTCSLEDKKLQKFRHLYLQENNEARFEDQNSTQFWTWIQAYEIVKNEIGNNFNKKEQG